MPPVTRKSTCISLQLPAKYACSKCICKIENIFISGMKTESVTVDLCYKPFDPKYEKHKQLHKRLTYQKIVEYLSSLKEQETTKVCTPSPTKTRRSTRSFDSLGNWAKISSMGREDGEEAGTEQDQDYGDE